MTGITDEMVERSARALCERAGGDPDSDWAPFNDDYIVKRWMSYLDDARTALTAAFPNLANGTTWEAPMEATEEMIVAGAEVFRDWDQDFQSTVEGAQDTWPAMRNSYLATGKGGVDGRNDLLLCGCRSVCFRHAVFWAVAIVTKPKESPMPDIGIGIMEVKNRHG